MKKKNLSPKQLFEKLEVYKCKMCGAEIHETEEDAIKHAKIKPSKHLPVGYISKNPNEKGYVIIGSTDGYLNPLHDFIQNAFYITVAQSGHLYRYEIEEVNSRILRNSRVMSDKELEDAKIAFDLDGSRVVANEIKSRGISSKDLTNKLD